MPPNPYEGTEAKESVTPTSTTVNSPYAGTEEKRIYEPSEVPGKAAESVGKFITEDIPKTLNTVAKKPSVIKEGLGAMAESLLSLASLPITGTAYGAAKLFGKDAQAERLKKEVMQPGLEALYGLQDSYGGWLSGGEGMGPFSPKHGVQTVGRHVAEHPLGTASDVLPVVGPAARVVKTGGEAALTAAGRAVGVIPKTIAAADAAAAVQRLTDMGIRTDHLLPDQIERLRVRGNELGWDKAKMAQEYQHTLFDEAGVAPTNSMATGSREKQLLEDNMRNGTQGMRAADIINDADEARRAGLVERGDKVRADLTGNPTAMEPKAVGETISERYNVANQAARNNVKAAYEKAFDPVELANRGIPPSVNETVLKGVPDAAVNKMLGNGFVTTAEAAPNAAQALKALQEWAASGRLPSALPAEMLPPPGTSGASWKSVDIMRKYVNGLRESAKANGTDLYAMRQILDAFDEQLGKGNPLLNDARAMHSDRVKTFEPGRWQAKDLNTALKIMQHPEESGLAQFNRLFGSGAFKSGEAITSIERLKDVFANDPAGLAAMKEGALQNLFLGKTYDPLSPKLSSNAIKAALNGPQADIYKTLFTPDELAQLARHQEVLDRVGSFTQPKNPPKTAQVKEALDRSKEFEAKGKARVGAYTDTAGTIIGALLGHASGLGPAGIGGGFTAGGVGAHYGPSKLISEWLGPKKGQSMERAANAAEGERAQSLINPAPPTVDPGLNYTPSPALSAAALMNTSRPERARGGALRRVR